MNEVILVINSGSANIKFSVYSNTIGLNLLYHGILEIGNKNSKLRVLTSQQIQITNQEINSNHYAVLFRHIFNWFNQLPQKYSLTAVGHRVVHGGSYFLKPTLITPTVVEQIKNLAPLAPLHQYHNVDAMEIIIALYPTVVQIACFDTCFHQTQEPIAKLFALPKRVTEDKIIRYGFHGISYEYIAAIITQQLGALGNEKVIVAHLGNGASMCAMYKCQSVATSMGFTALDGLMMGSRCGRVDPGVLLYLLQEKHYSVDKLQYMLYHESGLLGVSGISHDMRELVLSNNPAAIEAIELFCYRAALEFGSLSMALGGCDVLVFTAGIGEHIPQIRQKICTYLHWLGVELDSQANTDNAVIISTKKSKVLVSVIPTNEEYIIAKHAQFIGLKRTL